MSTRGGEARQATTVKIIETVHVEADRYSFKSIVQRLTGRDAVVGDYSDGPPERRSNEEAAQRAIGYVIEQPSQQALR